MGKPMPPSQGYSAKRLCPFLDVGRPGSGSTRKRRGIDKLEKLALKEVEPNTGSCHRWTSPRSGAHPCAAGLVWGDADVHEASEPEEAWQSRSQTATSSPSAGFGARRVRGAELSAVEPPDYCSILRSGPFPSASSNRACRRRASSVCPRAGSVSKALRFLSTIEPTPPDAAARPRPTRPPGAGPKAGMEPLLKGPRSLAFDRAIRIRPHAAPNATHIHRGSKAASPPGGG